MSDGILLAGEAAATRSLVAYFVPATNCHRQSRPLAQNVRDFS
jgi:hypothetical protein